MRRLVLVLALLVAGGMACGRVSKTLQRTPLPLRVGMSPENPPLAFRRAEQVVGIEVDLAARLASDLGAALDLVELPANDLIAALERGQIDVVMSGLTVTPTDQRRVAFGAPYLRTGLVAMMRRRDAARFDTRAKILGTAARVGVIEGTIADRFARAHLAQATIALYARPQDAVWELRHRYIDLVVNDLPQAAWIVAQHESELAATWTPLTDDALAWAFRPSDEALRASADHALARWKADGTLNRTLRRWLGSIPMLP
jgi:polar amino acid transport system substrate-binding protein